jgi:hypothetical protein
LLKDHSKFFTPPLALASSGTTEVKTINLKSYDYADDRSHPKKYSRRKSMLKGIALPQPNHAEGKVILRDLTLVIGVAFVISTMLIYVLLYLLTRVK